MTSLRRVLDGRRRAPSGAPWAWLIVALLVRTGMAWRLGHPGYIDAYYDAHVAANLLAGRGLVEDVAWNYLSPPAALPRPSNAYWPPGAAIFAAAGAWLPAHLLPGLLPLWRWLQLAPVIGSALLVTAAWILCRRLAPGPAASRRASAVAGLMLFSGVYFPYWVTTETFTPFALFGGAALWLAAEGARRRAQGSRLWFGAGLAAGLAQAIRPDGLLLALAAGLCTRGATRAWVLLGFVLGAAPWMVRNWLTWGSLAPPGAGRALWLLEYDDLFAFQSLPSLERWLGAGPAVLLGARVSALWLNLAVAGQPLLYYLVPAAGAGLWWTRSRPEMRPALVYGAVLYAVMSLVFPWPGVRGGLFHSMSALLPFLLLWAVVGVEGLVARAARWRGWAEPEAQRAFAAALVAFGALSSLYFALTLPARWDARLAAYGAAARRIDALAPATARVMSVDPPGFWYASGRSGNVVPSDGLSALVAAALAFHDDFLILEPNGPSYLGPIYMGTAATPDLELVAVVGELRVYRIVAPELPAFG